MAYLDTSGLSTREKEDGGIIPTFLNIGISNNDLTAIEISGGDAAINDSEDDFYTTINGNLEITNNVVINQTLHVQSFTLFDQPFFSQDQVALGFPYTVGLISNINLEVSGNSWIHGNFIKLSNSSNFFEKSPQLYITNNSSDLLGSYQLDIQTLVTPSNLSWANSFNDEAVVIQDSALYIDGSGYDYTNLYVQGKSFFNNDICLNQSLIMGRGLYVGGVTSSLNDLCVHENLIGSVTLGHIDYQDNIKLDVCGNVAFGINNRIDLSSIASGVVGYDNSLNSALYSFVSGKGNNIKEPPAGDTFQSNYIFGINNTISGDFNFINGVSNEIAGDFNMTLGINNTVREDAQGSILLGTGLDTSSNNCVVVGHFNEDISNATFVVGTGANDTSRVNSFTVMMNGRVGLNTIEPLTNLDICGNGGVILPRGTSSQRLVLNNGGDEYLGLVRYNTETKSFEGFGAGNSWGSLGGVIDVSQCSYVTAEDYASAANKQIKFYVNRVDSNNEPIAPSSNTDGSGYVMIIDSSGWVGIGNHQDDGKYTPLTILDLSCGDSQGDMSGACGLILPRGGTGERPISSDHSNYDDMSGSYLGCIRYNDDTSSFEGFGAGNSWGTLGGVIDVDQSTYITAEDFADASNNSTTNHSTKSLKFYINNSNTPSDIASSKSTTHDTSYNMILTGGGDVCQLGVCTGKSPSDISSNLGGGDGIYTSGDIVVDGNIFAEGDISVNGNINLDGNVTVSTNLIVTGVGGSALTISVDDTTTTTSTTAILNPNIADTQVQAQFIPSEEEISLPIWKEENNKIFLNHTEFNVGIGTKTPLEKLHIKKNILVEGKVKCGDNIYFGNLYNNYNTYGLIQYNTEYVNDKKHSSFHIYSTIDNSLNKLIYSDPNTDTIYFNSNLIDVNGSLHSSDDRIKHQETTISGALETIQLLKPKSYLKSKNMYSYDFSLNQDKSNLKDGDVLRKESGLIAQDLLTIPGVSDYVYQNKNNNSIPMKVDYNSIFNLNIKATQELNEKLEQKFNLLEQNLTNAHLEITTLKAELENTKTNLETANQKISTMQDIFEADISNLKLKLEIDISNCCSKYQMSDISYTTMLTNNINALESNINIFKSNTSNRFNLLELQNNNLNITVPESE